MMIAPVVPYMVLSDFVGCMGVGLFLALIYDVVSFFVIKKNWSYFFLDLFIFFVASIMIYSYAMSMSYSTVVRWYMYLGVGCGYASYMVCITPFTNKIKKVISKIIVFPINILKRNIIIPIKKMILVHINKSKARKQTKKHKIQENNSEYLQNKIKIVYNSN